MATNVDIKNALLKRLDIQEAGLYKRAGAMRRKLPMTAEDSVHLIAFQEGININKYLTAEQVQSVRHLHTQFVQASGTAPAATAPSSKWRAPTSSTGDREIRFPNEFKVTNPLLPTEKLNEAKAMAAIYPLLYVVENSMREVIKRVMAKQFGEDWWNTEMTTSKLKNVHDTVASRMTTEKKNSWHPEAWSASDRLHGCRGPRDHHPGQASALYSGHHRRQRLVYSVHEGVEAVQKCRMSHEPTR